MSAEYLKSPLIVVEEGYDLENTTSQFACQSRRIRCGAIGLVILVAVSGLAGVALTPRLFDSEDTSTILSSKSTLIEGPTADLYRQDARLVAERQVVAEKISLKLSKSLDRGDADLKGIDVKPEDMIHWAEKAWEIIKDNKPVVNINHHYATVLPKGTSTMEDMSDWSDPVVQGPYALTGKNRWNQVVASVEYSLVYQHSGRYEGKGRYLSHVGIVIHNTDVVWSNGLQASVVTDEPTNCGSIEDPIAGLTVDVQFTVDTWTKHDVLEHSFFVRGDGGFEEIHADKHTPKAQLDDDEDAGDQEIIWEID